MLDFLMVAERPTKRGVDIYPKFVMRKSTDLMIRGGDFYAIWVESQNRWSTNEQDAIQLIDQETHMSRNISTVLRTSEYCICGTHPLV